jgi:transposase-like protein
MDEEYPRHEDIRCFLLLKRFPDGVVKCPACDCAGSYHLKTGRYRCTRRKYTFNLTTGTWLALVKIPAPKWLALVRAYSDMEKPSTAAELSGTSRATARRVFDLIHKAIYLHQHQRGEHD